MDVLEYYSAVLGQCDLPTLASLDLLVESCAIACAEDDRCVGFRHLNASFGWDKPSGSCLLQTEKCKEPWPVYGAMTYTKGKGIMTIIVTVGSIFV